jgi:hypothetical protein
MRLRWPGAVADFPSAKPTIILDIDETLLWRHGGWLERARLYAAPRALVGTPYAGAQSAVAELSKRYRFVAVTARNSAAEANTLLWLQHHGFGHVPVVHTPSVFPWDSGREVYKASAIRFLAGAGWAPIVAGVGDRPSDLTAYAAAGLRCIMVVHANPGVEKGADSARAVAAFDALQAAAAGAGTGSVPLRLTTVTDVAGVTAAAVARGAALLGDLHSYGGGGPVPVWEQIRDLSRTW